MSRLFYYQEMAGKVFSSFMIPKIWNYMKYRCLPRRSWVATGCYRPQIGSLILTMRCNLDCGYCNASKMLHEHGEKWRDYEATLERVRQIEQHPLYRDCLLIDLMGGEPLLVHDLEKIVAYLAGRGHVVNMSTNGLLLKGRIAALKDAGIGRVNVSLYDANRQVIDRDLEQINKIFRVHTSLVLLRRDVEKQSEQLMERVRFSRDAGCRGMRFFMYRPLGASPMCGEVLLDNDPAYLDFRRRIEAAFPGFCSWPVPVVSAPVRKRCAQLWQRITCDMSGQMQACCGVDSYLQGKHGNLFGGTPDEVFNHPVLVDMRRQMLDPAGDPPDVCKKCNLLGDPGW